MKVNNNNKYLISLEDWLKIINKPEFKKKLNVNGGRSRNGPLEILDG